MILCRFPPFGCRTSALPCALTTRAVVGLLRRRGFFPLCYLDNFVGIRSSRHRAEQAYIELLSIRVVGFGSITQDMLSSHYQISVARLSDRCRKINDYNSLRKMRRDS